MCCRFSLKVSHLIPNSIHFHGEIIKNDFMDTSPSWDDDISNFHSAAYTQYYISEDVFSNFCGKYDL